MGAPAPDSGTVIGRYVVYDEIAAGGMASVHLARQIGAVGFSRTVAVKRLHAHLARDDEFATMFLDEARLAARIRHPNVVQVLDVVHDAGELFLVMDFVHGEPLSRLVRAIRPGAVPPRIAVAIVVGALKGLHAAHEATTEHGEPLHIVHRDVSPQNVMVGTDGVARVLDFGVAKAAHRIQTTQEGSVKGKVAYMAPEQLLGEDVDRRADVYSASVVLWEALTGERLFDSDNQGRTVRKILDEPIPPPSKAVPGLSRALDAVVMRGLERDPSRRWQTVLELATALERALSPASSTEVGEWVESIGGAALDDRARRVKEIESRSDVFDARAARDAAAGQVREAAETKVDGRERAREDIVKPTVPLGFATMDTEPGGPPPGAAPPKGTQQVTQPISSAQLQAARPISSPGLQAEQLAASPASEAGAPSSSEVQPTSSSRRTAVPAPLASLGVQAVAVTPLASLEDAARKRSGGRRMLLAGIVLAVLGLLAVAGAGLWTALVHR